MSARTQLPTEEQTIVTASDLSSVPDALRVLSVLNDQYASAYDLAPSVEHMPALVARITRAYSRAFYGRAIPNLANQLGGLGNRRFEELLFKYLEDLTMLRAELEAEE